MTELINCRQCKNLQYELFTGKMYCNKSNEHCKQRENFDTKNEKGLTPIVPEGSCPGIEEIGIDD